MTTLREAAQQALEALDKATRYMSDSDYRKLNEAIDVLKAALEQYDEDVAYMTDRYDNWRKQTQDPTPPRREWRGLTEEEILTEAARYLGEMHVENCSLGDIKDFALAVEAKLKERNV